MIVRIVFCVNFIANGADEGFFSGLLAGGMLGNVCVVCVTRGRNGRSVIAHTALADIGDTALLGAGCFQCCLLVVVGMFGAILQGDSLGGELIRSI